MYGARVCDIVSQACQDWVLNFQKSNSILVKNKFGRLSSGIEKASLAANGI